MFVVVHMHIPTFKHTAEVKCDYVHGGDYNNDVDDSPRNGDWCGLIKGLGLVRTEEITIFLGGGWIILGGRYSEISSVQA